MKKIKDFIYNNKKSILLFILLILFNICMATCNLPKAKAQSGIAELNDIWGKSWQVKDNIEVFNFSSANDIEVMAISSSRSISEDTEFSIGTVNNSYLKGGFSAPQNFTIVENKDILMLQYYGSTSTMEVINFIDFTNLNGSKNYNTVAFGGNYLSDSAKILLANATQFIDTESNISLINANNGGNIITLNIIDKPEYLDFVYIDNQYMSETALIEWWNRNFIDLTTPIIRTNNLNIYVNEQLAYNDSIEFIETAVSPSIQYIYSNYTINQMGFGNLAKPLKYTANEFIANVFNQTNETNNLAFIDFAFTGNYLVGLSYEYTNMSGQIISNSFELVPDDEESLRLIALTDLERNTDINIRITTNNLNDFESGAVNSAFKTLFGFFDEIINIQFGFITIGQILGFILAIAIIGLIYKVWNGGNND